MREQFIAAAVIALVSIGFVPLRAHAAPGVITGLVVAPSSPELGSPATVTINGSGTCGTLSLSFGDGTPALSLSNKALPASATHTYASGGAKSLIAKGIRNCFGQASANVTVFILIPPGILHDLYCYLAGCAPKIELVFANATPGGSVALGGSDFGYLPGTVQLKLTDVNGSVVTSTLTGSDWQGNWGTSYASGTIPWTITGVTDQTGTLQVTTKAGKVSNSWPVRFRPLLAMEVMPWQLIAATCSTAGSDNNCQGIGALVGNQCLCGFGGLGCALSTNMAGITVAGQHDSWYTIGGDNGTDHFAYQLRNGWLVEFGIPEVSMDESDESAIFNGPVAGASDVVIDVVWSTDWCSYVAYDDIIYVIGPVGVPM